MLIVSSKSKNNNTTIRDDPFCDSQVLPWIPYLIVNNRYALGVSCSKKIAINIKKGRNIVAYKTRHKLIIIRFKQFYESSNNLLLTFSYTILIELLCTHPKPIKMIFNFPLQNTV